MALYRSGEKEIKDFLNSVNKSWFISLFHRKETEHVVKTAGKVTSYKYASRDLGLRLEPFFCGRFKYRRE